MFLSPSDSLQSLRQETYVVLKKMASKRLAHNSLRNIVSASSLVHDSLLKLNRSDIAKLTCERELYATCAYIMRSVLVDIARKRQCFAKFQLLLEVGNQIGEKEDFDSEDFLALDDSLTKLMEVDPDASQVVHLHVFCGLKFDEVSRITQLSQRTVYRYWAFGCAWLKAELDSGRS